jgi:hypothetical protein
MPFNVRSEFAMIGSQCGQAEPERREEIVEASDGPIDADRLVSAFRTLARATDDILGLAHQVGLPAAVVSEVASWGELVMAFADAGRAIVEAEFAAQLEVLRCALRQHGGPISADIAEARDPLRSIQERHRLATSLEEKLDSLRQIDLVTFPSRDEMNGAIATVASIDILAFVVDDVPPPERSGLWLGVIEQPLRTSRQRVLCETADTAVRAITGPHPDTLEHYLQRFTRRIVGLPREFWYSVASAISEGRWRSADKPVAYVRTAAQAMAGREARGGLDYRSRDVLAQLGSEAPCSLDLPGPGRELTDDPLAALIPSREGDQPFDDVGRTMDFEAALIRAGLGADGIAFAQARLDGVPRSAMAEHLKWSPQKVRKVEQALRRGLPRLRADYLG